MSGPMFLTASRLPKHCAQAILGEGHLYWRALRLGRLRESLMAKLIDIQDASKAVLNSALNEASAVLEQGGVIAVPTETIYGVATSVTSDRGIERVYALKGRERGKPVAICLSSIEEVDKWAKRTVSRDLLRELLPGPVTVVFERAEVLNPRLNPTTHLVGIRVPDYPFVRQLVERCSHPMALTSANISSSRSTLAVEEFEELWPDLDLVVNGGKITDSEDPNSRRGSTVVDLSQSGKFRVIREGSSYGDTVEVLNKYHLTEIVS